MRGTPVRLDELTKRLSRDVLTKRVDDRWSIQEHVGHLLDLDELHDGRIDDYLSNSKILRPADLKNIKTHEAAHNSNSIKNLLNSFREVRSHFVDRLESLEGEVVSRIALHPRLDQPMRLVDMAFFTADHDDHHLAKLV